MAGGFCAKAQNSTDQKRVLPLQYELGVEHPAPVRGTERELTVKTDPHLAPDVVAGTCSLSYYATPQQAQILKDGPRDHQYDHGYKFPPSRSFEMGRGGASGSVSLPLYPGQMGAVAVCAFVGRNEAKTAPRMGPAMKGVSAHAIERYADSGQGEALKHRSAQDRLKEFDPILGGVDLVPLGKEIHLAAEAGALAIDIVTGRLRHYFTRVAVAEEEDGRLVVRIPADQPLSSVLVVFVPGMKVHLTPSKPVGTLLARARVLGDGGGQ